MTTQFDKDPWPLLDAPTSSSARQPWLRSVAAHQARDSHTTAFEQRGFGGTDLAPMVAVISGLDES